MSNIFDKKTPIFNIFDQNLADIFRTFLGQKDIF